MTDRKLSAPRAPRYRDMTDREVLDRCLATGARPAEDLVAEVIARFAMRVIRDGDAKPEAGA